MVKSSNSIHLKSEWLTSIGNLGTALYISHPFLALESVYPVHIFCRGKGRGPVSKATGRLLHGVDDLQLCGHRYDRSYCTQIERHIPWKTNEWKQKISPPDRTLCSSITSSECFLKATTRQRIWVKKIHFVSITPCHNVNCCKRAL